MKDSYIYYEDKLGEEYKAVFGQIEMYVMSRNVDEDAAEERLGELLDIFLIAQDAGKPVREITGNNLESFCETFCSDFGMKNGFLHILQWMKSIAKVLVFISALDLFFAFLDALETEGTDFWNAMAGITTFNISGYLIGIAIAGLFTMAVNIVIRRKMFKVKKVSMKHLRAVSCVSAILGFLIIYSMLSISETELFHCPAWVLLAVSCVYLLLYHLFYGRYNKRGKIKFLDLIEQETKKDFPAEMEKKFQKARKKNLKKGKGDLTLEAFLDKEEANCAKVEKQKILFYVLPVIAVAAAFLFTLQNEGFDSGTDMAIFLIIMLAVECPLMRGLWKLTSIGVKERRSWIQSKRSELLDKLPIACLPEEK